jgi:ABC-2 type transport system permease protein
LTPGALKTVVIVKPQSTGPNRQRYTALEKTLAENVRLKEADLKNGRVPEEADLLLVLAPDQLNDEQRFAVDQFLMQGGSVIITTSPFDVRIAGTLTATRKTSGLQEWLTHHGITIEETMVLDQQNAALPVPVERQIGGLTVHEIACFPIHTSPTCERRDLARTLPSPLRWVS